MTKEETTHSKKNTHFKMRNLKGYLTLILDRSPSTVIQQSRFISGVLIIAPQIIGMKKITATAKVASSAVHLDPLPNTELTTVNKAILAQYKDVMSIERLHKSETSLIKPKPPGSDDCCMSGCVNCVWNTFQEDLDQYNDHRRAIHERKKVLGAVGANEDFTAEKPSAEIESMRSFVEMEKKLRITQLETKN